MRKGGWLTLSMFLLLVSFSQSNTNLSSLFYEAPQDRDTITIFSWNTLWWNAEDNEHNFYSFLANQKADIYHLQEFSRNKEDVERLKAYLPGYRIIAYGNVATATKWPVEHFTIQDEGRYLRTDININGVTISTFNMHLPIHMIPGQALVPHVFLSELNERFYWRAALMRELREDMSSTPYPIVVSGDFNTSPSMGGMEFLHHDLIDSVVASPSFYPVTWNTSRFYQWWRLDYLFSSHSIPPVSHELISYSEESDHKALVVELALPFNVITPRVLFEHPGNNK